MAAATKSRICTPVLPDFALDRPADRLGRFLFCQVFCQVGASVTVSPSHHFFVFFPPMLWSAPFPSAHITDDFIQHASDMQPAGLVGLPSLIALRQSRSASHSFLALRTANTNFKGLLSGPGAQRRKGRPQCLDLRIPTPSLRSHQRDTDTSDV